ncbi:MAG: sodium-dependent transporter, partial [Proteobacteria bacterium]|nr:sodium-dependent transporter [Pseudomonadota bacterium]
AVTALRLISPSTALRNLGAATGIAGFIVASLILIFYAIVAGWMIAFCLSSVANLLGMSDFAAWLTSFGLWRNILFMLIFITFTIGIISAGVKDGIERWSARLMPALLITLFLLVAYVLTLDGASEGLKVFLLPDFERALSPKLIIAALGAAFFSLSLGVGTMLIYGSYISDDENLPVVGGLVTLVDISIAVLAGFLVLPAMYVALHNGVEIFTPTGALISEDTLIFTVLPELFATMGTAGIVVSFTFFFLMGIAALTSSISMLEVPVAYVIEEHGLKRKTAVSAIGGIIAVASSTILLNFENLFGLVVAFTTRYSQPVLGFMFCIYAGWVWHRDTLLQELRKGNPDVEQGLFWKIWPWYVKLVCPVIILGIFAQSLWG